MADPLSSFHPAIRGWFQRRFAAPTDAQSAGWPSILAGRDTLIAAPTGSGKTLAAFLASIDRLWRRAEARGLEDAIDVLYVSPLKALSNDIQRNLEQPLEEIREVARELGCPEADIRAMVRTGDTPQSARQAMAARPPHILITTPESLYLMLTAERARETLRDVKTVIVDEIHALVRDKRGSHLALSLARLDHLCRERPARVGLSATQHPIEETARFLVGADRLKPDGSPDCVIVDLGHQRDIDLAIEVPATDLQAVCSGDQWKDIYERLAALIQSHRTTLVFVNTRRLAERVAHHLAERLGEEQVASHHGSLSKERRLSVEERLKAGELKALVATASLELGIDIGTVDLVCQIGSPRSVTTFLQRVGRSGHALGLTPRGRLFATTRDDLVECAALVRAVRAGRLDRVEPPAAPLDILAQQVVAECACEPWPEDGLFDLVRRAAPYASLDRRGFDEVIEMLSEGLGPTRTGRYLHRDRINRVLRGRRNARLTALQCGGAIPEVADYRVIAEPEGTFVGTLDEDFAIESMAGDIILLGSTSWRIRRIEAGVVRVDDAGGAPPSIPFWLGEAPSRTLELSEEVARLRRDLAGRLEGETSAFGGWLAGECGLEPAAAEQLVQYVRAGRDSLGVIPSDTDVVFERFFDDSGGMQLVVHAPFGGRINRAWGLALRKRFCVIFDFELQAAANDDAIVLSLGPQHSFPLEDAFGFVRSSTAREAVSQALLVAPMFKSRWRWNATRSLAVQRQRGGKRVPTPIQRMRSEDLLAAVFPRLAACQENVTGPVELPDHPLVRQTLNDCLYEAMDLVGFERVLRRIEEGEVRLHARDTTEPSPMAHEILNSKPYTYLDDAPLEERRTRAVSLRRTLPESARDLGALDEPRDPDELHEALLGLVAVRPTAAAGWQEWFDALATSGRAAVARFGGGEALWFAAENLPLVQALHPEARIDPPLALPDHLRRPADREEALLALLRGHMEVLGPVTVEALARRVLLSPGETASALARLEGEGLLLRGRFTPGLSGEEFCDRRLLARIHRYTLDRLRREIEPVTAQDLVRFLLRWQHLAPGSHLEGKRGLLEAVAQLQGFEIAASAWERHILSARIPEYRPSWLDELCLSGDVAWGRLSPRRAPASGNGARAASPSSSTPVSLALRTDLPGLLAAVRDGEQPAEPEVGPARDVLDLLQARGALFYDDIVEATRRLPFEVERALWELVARGLVTADGFQSLRALMRTRYRRRLNSIRRRAPFTARSLVAGPPEGRWSLLPGPPPDETSLSDGLVEAWAGQLLTRYGIVFRDMVQRESFAVPWRDVLRALRRQEARGLVRGGRFVGGFYGEQYALPEAVEGLRQARRREKTDELIRVNAADPLNLVGVITPGPRVPAVPTNTVIYRDGVPVASEEGRRTVARAQGAEEALASFRKRLPGR
ncbi:MAG: DEAD/DEAH box helicase [Chloroflexi bacterium]|nr:DEAD/DEAH box helicase [Chloroflexota bacterium]